MRQHQGHAAGHQRGLAAAGACFDEKGCAVIQQRALPGASIRKGRGVMAAWHHCISQSGARSARPRSDEGKFQFEVALLGAARQGEGEIVVGIGRAGSRQQIAGRRETGGRRGKFGSPDSTASGSAREYSPPSAALG